MEMTAKLEFASHRCLTAPQIETVKMAYSDARKRNGDLIYPGLVPGSETGWLLPGRSTEPGGIDLGMFRYIAHQDAAWDWRNFDLERDTELLTTPKTLRRSSRPRCLESVLNFPLFSSS